MSAVELALRLFFGVMLYILAGVGALTLICGWIVVQDNKHLRTLPHHAVRNWWEGRRRTA